MIEPERWVEARRLHQVENLSITAIAQQLGLDRKTVRKVLAAEKYEALPRPSTRRPSKLDPYVDTLRELVARRPGATATQLHRDLVRNHGFTGSVYLVRRHLRKLRQEGGRAYLRLTHLPGECAQVDWAHFGYLDVEGTRRRVSAFVIVLMYSRLMYAELSLSEKMDAFLEGHVRAFRYFEGVPKRCLYDSCRTVVIQRSGHGKRFHPRLLDFADHYLFKVSVCPPRRPWHKGGVESAIGYLRKSFHPGRGVLEDLESARRELRRWLDETANQRVHRTTGETPQARFEAAERAALLPLPERHAETAHVEPSVSVDKFYRVTFDGNRYTVPWRLAHRKGLLLKATTDRVEIFLDGELVARHRRTYGRGIDVRDPQHDAGLRERARRARRSQLTERFVALFGELGEAYACGLAREHVRAIHHLRRIVRLTERYGADDVRQALSAARQYDAFGADYVERILHQLRHQRLEEREPLSVIVRDQELAAVYFHEPDLSVYDPSPRTGEADAQEPQEVSDGPDEVEVNPLASRSDRGEPRVPGSHESPPDLPRPSRPGDEAEPEPPRVP